MVSLRSHLCYYQQTKTAFGCFKVLFTRVHFPSNASKSCQHLCSKTLTLTIDGYGFYGKWWENETVLNNLREQNEKILNNKTHKWVKNNILHTNILHTSQKWDINFFPKKTRQVTNNSKDARINNFGQKRMSAFRSLAKTPEKISRTKFLNKSASISRKDL